MRSKLEWRAARVVAINYPAEDVRAVTFAVEGLRSAFDPGSHTNIKVLIRGEAAVRTYTVLPSAPGELRIAVKLHPNSRGGSAYIWSLAIGDETEMTEPENRFELSWRASRYLLVAGGIGITPIYGMARALAARNQQIRLIYGAKGLTQMAFASELRDLLGDRLETFVQDAGEQFDLAAEFAALPPDGEAYICGPHGLLEAARTIWRESGRSMSRLRFEVFGDSGRFVEQAFSVSVPAYDRTVAVRPDQTMLDALIEAGIDMIYDCRRGECGLCAVDVLDASTVIDHRDVFFSAHERHDSAKMCACVSRAAGGAITIGTGYQPEGA
ncbi:PDR/VanB family oxidoreductase [Rhizobium sp. FKL33]|uniref:PDR/VanB family oxidoreductase n=1 Tax=Rhizobium sp. FKL33 TaxID=2562307 RepID=UPI0010BFBA11|nr:PDR/VanB family oxidoreductase [Rhizobium sp. FKL33]